MLAQFVQDFVHFECREDRFDQHRGANRAAGNPHIVLREIKNVVPQARFLVALHLRQIEIRPRSVREQTLGVMEKEQAEIEQRARDRLAVHEEMLFIQVPAAGTNEQRGNLFVELVALPFRTDVA